MAFDPKYNKQRMDEVEEMIRQVDSLSGTACGDSVRKAICMVLEIHTQGLKRIIRMIKRSAPAGEPLLKAMTEDETVAGLLLLHGLHPSSVEERVRGAVEKVRQYVTSHGGDVELVSVSEDAVNLRMKGKCEGCPAMTNGLKLVVERAVTDAAPDVAAINIET